LATNPSKQSLQSNTLFEGKLSPTLRAKVESHPKEHKVTFAITSISPVAEAVTAKQEAVWNFSVDESAFSPDENTMKQILFNAQAGSPAPFRFDPEHVARDLSRRIRIKQLDPSALDEHYGEVSRIVLGRLKASGLLVFTDSIKLVASIPRHVQKGDGDKRSKLESSIRIFLVRVTNDTSPYFVLDDTDTITENTSGTLYLNAFAEDKARTRLGTELRDDDWTELKNALAQIGRRFKKDEDGGFGELVSYVSTHLYRPAAFLESLDFIQEPGVWGRLVGELVEFHAKKDPEMALAFKATILEGVEMSANPHSFILTNSSTSKTEPHQFAGKVLDRITAKSLIGAYRQDGLSSGSMSNFKRSVVIEQIESQDAPNLLSFLFNLLETGEAYQEIGGYKKFIHSLATVVITGNPQLSTDLSGQAQSDAFSIIIAHLTSNRALGRRFGIILFGNDYKPVARLKGGLDGRLEREEYAALWEIFREVERLCRDKIERLYARPKVAQFLDSVDNGYSEEVTRIAAKLGEKWALLHGFLTDHSGFGQRHLRGGALKCAILDMLPEIASDGYSIEDLLARANSYLEQLTINNLASIARLAEAGQHYGAEMATALLPRLPSPLALVVEAGMNFKRVNPGAVAVPLGELEGYRPNKSDAYWSLTVNHCLDIKIEKYADSLERYFGMKIDRETRMLSFVA
jgi:hypothetical protein